MVGQHFMQHDTFVSFSWTRAFVSIAGAAAVTSWVKLVWTGEVGFTGISFSSTVNSFATCSLDTSLFSMYKFGAVLEAHLPAAYSCGKAVIGCYGCAGSSPALATELWLNFSGFGKFKRVAKIFGISFSPWIPMFWAYWPDLTLKFLINCPSQTWIFDTYNLRSLLSSLLISDKKTQTLDGVLSHAASLARGLRFQTFRAIHYHAHLHKQLICSLKFKFGPEIRCLWYDFMDRHRWKA